MMVESYLPTMTSTQQKVVQLLEGMRDTNAHRGSLLIAAQGIDKFTFIQTRSIWLILSALSYQIRIDIFLAYPNGNWKWDYGSRALIYTTMDKIYESWLIWYNGRFPVGHEVSFPDFNPCCYRHSAIGFIVVFLHHQSHKKHCQSVCLPLIAKLVDLDEANQPSKTNQSENVAYRNPVPRLTIL